MVTSVQAESRQEDATRQEALASKLFPSSKSLRTWVRMGRHGPRKGQTNLSSLATLEIGAKRSISCSSTYQEAQWEQTGGPRPRSHGRQLSIHTWPLSQCELGVRDPSTGWGMCVGCAAAMRLQGHACAREATDLH